MRCSDKLLLNSWIRQYIIRYVDDFFVRTPTFELHCRVLIELFRLCKEANLVPNWDKCTFLRTSVKILGYILDETGLHPNPEKIAPILQLAQPKNVTEIESFLGVCSYYHRMIPDFSTLAEPLTRLTRKDKKFNWESEQQLAFKAIKEALISEPVVRLPDFTRDFILATDASEVGISGVLSQKFDDGEFPVHFVSRTLTQTELRYPTIHKEALAIMWAIERLEGYLAYKPFLLLSDSKPLKYIRELKNPKGQSANWNWKLQKYAYTHLLIPGKHNLLPDLTSRSFSANIKVSPIALKTPIRDTWYLDLLDKVTRDPQKYPLFKVSNRKLFKLVKSWNKWESSEYKEVVPKCSRKKVMEQNHCRSEAGHFGFFKTFNKITEHHYILAPHALGHFKICSKFHRVS
jgi:RNase H-like domain found in reverse transcriptase/Integrase zinc binding domain